PGTCILAPDLRGRGRSATVPHDDFATHAADMRAVLDHAGIRTAVLAGHSMGAYVVARLAADAPERAAAVLLIDGGLPLPMPPGADPDVLLDLALGPAIARLKMSFASPEDYIAYWKQHPSLKDDWTDDMDAYARYDLTGSDGELRSVVSEPAVRADMRALLLDEETRRAAERIRAPLTILRAPRGLLNDENVLIPDAALQAFRAAVPGVESDLIPDVNHYTLVMAEPGATRVAAAIRAALPHASRA
ncbi:MAG TPA: alpha/beta hydrolase, partial [Solirubrobacteraceae bacterium]|nr:alpha/beta hydrolase [Solirubrobacteraceae bacterium]